jgi:6-phosphogluconate dehydrogenase
MKKTMMKANIGVIGLAVMGRNLALNIESRGFTVAVFNRSPEKSHDLLNSVGQGKNLVGAFSVEVFVISL